MPKGQVRRTFFLMTIQSRKLPKQKTDQKTAKEKILDLLLENKHLTRVHLANKLGISESAIKQHIAKLKKDGILKRVGGRKIGHWEVI